MAVTRHFLLHGDPKPDDTKIVSYYVCDTEKDKPPLKQTTPGDLAYVKESKKLYVADGQWIKP